MTRAGRVDSRSIVACFPSGRWTLRTGHDEGHGECSPCPSSPWRPAPDAAMLARGHQIQIVGRGNARGRRGLHDVEVASTYSTPSVAGAPEDDPSRPTEVTGLGPVRAVRIAAAWADRRHIREVVAALRGYGISTSAAVRIRTKVGATAGGSIGTEPHRPARGRRSSSSSRVPSDGDDDDDAARSSTARRLVGGASLGSIAASPSSTASRVASRGWWPCWSGWLGTGPPSSPDRTGAYRDRDGAPVEMFDTDLHKRRTPPMLGLAARMVNFGSGAARTLQD